MLHGSVLVVCSSESHARTLTCRTKLFPSCSAVVRQYLLAAYLFYSHCVTHNSGTWCLQCTHWQLALTCSASPSSSQSAFRLFSPPPESPETVENAVSNPHTPRLGQGWRIAADPYLLCLTLGEGIIKIRITGFHTTALEGLAQLECCSHRILFMKNRPSTTRQG